MGPPGLKPRTVEAGSKDMSGPARAVVEDMRSLPGRVADVLLFQPSWGCLVPTRSSRMLFRTTAVRVLTGIGTANVSILVKRVFAALIIWWTGWHKIAFDPGPLDQKAMEAIWQRCARQVGFD
jgi:hypothetical protein